MSIFRKASLPVVLALVVFMVSGCIKVQTGGGGATADLGGIFMSDNKGARWRNISSIPTVTGAAKSFATVDIESVALDPGDPNAMYAGSVDNSLFFTYDAGETWQMAKGLGQVTIDAVAVDPQDKCTIYVSVANKVLKSVDCTRTWKPVYQDNSTASKIYAIAIDHHDSKNVFVGVSGASRGDLIKSSDAGGSWRVVENFKDSVKRIIINPTDSRIVYLIASKKGAFKSEDNGEKWAEMKKLSAAVKEFKLTGTINEMIISNADGKTIFLATSYGMVRSKDGGETWERIEVLTPEKQAVINDIAVNQLDMKDIYYVTNTTFYHSVDGGVNWTTLQVPSVRRAWKIMIHPKNPNMIYLAFKSLPKK